MATPSQDPAALTFLHTPFDPAEPAPTPSVRAAVLRVRGTLERLLKDEAMGIGGSDADLAAVDAVLARAGAARGLVPTIRGYGWGWRRDPGEVTRRCFPAVWSTAELLTGESRFRLKVCGSCGALFLDQSRNRSRRWCVMEGCGNREKVRQFRRRQRDG